MPEEARGRFIVLEGGEGTGKSTQCSALARRLRQSGLKVVETREPGGTPGAEAVRHLLKSGAVEKLGPVAEAIMISAARADHVDMVIRPAVESGLWVVCDRFSDSTRAYQGAGSGVSSDIISALERVAVGEMTPDLVILLDAPADVGLTRAKNRTGGEGDTDRFEQESLAFHRKLREAFVEIAGKNPDRYVIVDATQAQDRIEAEIWDRVGKRLGLKETAAEG